ncbi:MAG: ATP-dependent helicase HrpB [Candidatus Riflebacteria bacterium]|nr:ATP-dependent helicase HrpB [Candidatus Riflebacteria bacterium]
MTIPILPIETEIPALRAALRQGPAAVLVASPGAGKTTVVPLALLGEPWLGQGRILMLQPRRLAALNAARRMAALHGSTLGETVGYQVRFQKCLGPRTRIEVVTEGLLTRRLQRDPFLEGVGLLVFDEFHERSIHSDLGLAMAREVQQTVRPDLKILVMSATLEAEPVRRFLGDCPLVTGHGFLHPVTIGWLDRPADPSIPRAAAAAVRRVLAADPAGGDLLVFLPGAGEIARTQDLLDEDPAMRALAVTPLHGSLPLDRQDQAIRPQGRRKVVLATNIAETSLTIEGITAVIDTGWCRTVRLDPTTGLEKLELERISRANADQRAGRAGRTGPGRVLRLWTEAEHRQLPAAPTPEILRVDLGEVVLELAGWGTHDPAAFGWFQPPPAPALAAARQVLAGLGAIDPAGAITPLGRRMLELPIAPRLARMLVAAADQGLGRDAADLAALLGERDLALRPDERRASPFLGRSDFLWRLDLLQEARSANFQGRSATVDLRVARRVDEIARQLERIVRRRPAGGAGIRPAGDPPADRRSYEDRLLKLLLYGFPDRVARRRPRAGGGEVIQYVMVGGRGLRLDPGSSVRDSELVIVVAADGAGHGYGNEALIRWASHIEREWLEEAFPHLLRRDREVFFDRDRQAVVARRRAWFADLVLEEQVTALRPEDGPAVEAALAAEVRRDPAAVLAGSEAFDQLRWRLALLRSAGGFDRLPALDQAWFLEHLDRLVEGCRSLADLRGLDLVRFVERELEPAARRALDTHVPERLAVPTGSRVRLIYQAAGPPILRVKLQELFGLVETPRLVGGRVPVLIHLLSPAGRPLQITQDLHSFWQNGYPALRREMRGQYPRHPWPEDPLTAPPQRGVVRRPR